MMIHFSDREASILLGATLMHWGVPFRAVARQELSEQQQALVDEASDKLIGAAGDLSTLPSPGMPKKKFNSRIARPLLITVVEDCLNECGNDPTELRLQLRTGERQEVESLLELSPTPFHRNSVRKTRLILNIHTDSAALKSSCKSATSSMPTLSRTRPSSTPRARRMSSGMLACVIVAG